jgi:hypothetical protein
MLIPKPAEAGTLARDRISAFASYALGQHPAKCLRGQSIAPLRPSHHRVVADPVVR